MGKVHKVIQWFKIAWWFIDNYLLEPIFLSFAFFIIFTHIQDVFNAQGEMSLANFWEQLNMDIGQYPWVYIPFAIIFVWWLVSRVIHAKRDRDTQRRIETNEVRFSNILENNTRALNRIAELLDKWEGKNDDGESKDSL